MDDLRCAWRQIRIAPAFSLVVVGLIGIGIAANATIFTLVDTLLLKRLPVRNPGDLVRIVEHHPPIPDSSDFEYSYWKFLRAHSTSYSEVIGQADVTIVSTVDSVTDFVQVGVVTPNYFPVLGVHPALGGLSDSPDSAVLTDRYWRKKFSADPAVIGRTIQLNGHPFTIAGVTAPDFHGITVELNPDVRVPAKAAIQLVDPRPGPPREEGVFSYELVARLKPDVSLERARSETISLFDGWVKEYAAQHPNISSENLKLYGEIQVQRIDRGVSVLRDQFSTALIVLMSGVGLVLLMVCSNVAGLLLERATARQRETAVRLAVGASPARLMRQWLTESLVLSFLGGALGVALSWAAMPTLAAMIPPLRNRGGELLLLDPNFGLNWRVILFSFGACVLAALFAGSAPAWRAGRYDLGLSLRTSRSSTPVEGGITIFQVALCTLLLIQASLFVRTLQSMRSMDIGFDREHIVTFTLRPGQAKGNFRTFRDLLLAETRALPGVRGAAYARLGLLRGTGMKTTLGMPGERVSPSQFMNSSLNSVSPEYFDAMCIRIVAGRGFERADNTSEFGDESKGQGARLIPVVVNQALARRFFPGQDPIGKIFGTGAGVLKPNHQIIGVASDAQYRSLREPVPPTFYSNVLADDDDFGTILHVRAAGDPATLIAPVRELLKKHAASWSIREINLLRDEAERSIWRERLVAELAIGFAIVAGLLAAIGLYGTLAYYVSRNRRGIGIRVAIGAARSDVITLLAGRVTRLIAAGAALGLAASLALSEWVRALLFGVPPSDPISIGFAVALIISIAAVALLLPAWRALRIDPAMTLREE